MGAVGVGEAEFVSEQSEDSSSSAGSALQPGGPQPVGQPGKHPSAVTSFSFPPPLCLMSDTQIHI